MDSFEWPVLVTSPAGTPVDAQVAYRDRHAQVRVEVMEADRVRSKAFGDALQLAETVSEVGPAGQAVISRVPARSSEGAIAAQPAVSTAARQESPTPTGPPKPKKTPVGDEDDRSRGKQIPLLEQILLETSDVQAHLSSRVRQLEERLLSMPTRVNLAIASRHLANSEIAGRQSKSAERDTRVRAYRIPYGHNYEEGQQAEKNEKTVQKTEKKSTQKRKIRTTVR